MINIALLPAVTVALSMIAGAPPFVRTVEPRLSGAWQWRGCSKKKGTASRLVPEPVCGIPNFPRRLVSIAPGDCDEVTQTHTEAVEVLAASRDCTDAAIRTLKKLADAPRPSPAVTSDLAAAYFVRAQRKDRPSDLVRALEAADRAVALAPHAPEPRFNQALALEALGFDDKAIESWDQLGHRDGDGWATEAAAHSQRLSKRRAQQIGTEFSVSLLSKAVQSGDRAAVARLITPCPTGAVRYLHGTLLPAWAQARAAANEVESRRQLRFARIVATEFARVTGDRYLIDGVEQIVSSKSPRRLAAIQRGVLLSAAGKRGDAAEAFSAAGSPFRIIVLIGAATAMPLERPDRVLALLATAEQQARRNGYRYLIAQARIRRGFFLVRQSRLLDSLSEYDAAKTLCESMHDEEDLGIIHGRKLANFRVVGHNDLVWREALRARRYESRIADPLQRQLLNGELALSAVALGCPGVALHFQEAVVAMLRKQLGALRDGNSQIDGLRGALGVGLGQRAAIRGQLGDPRAYEDLLDAMRLVSDNGKEKSRLAQLHEIQGLLLRHSNPKAAADAFTKAYQLASPLYYRTYTASLLVARAEAWLLNGQRAAAEADLENAIGEFRREERGMLQERERGEGEELWSPYFSRSRDAYARLIRQLMEDGKTADAFRYAEQARAYELLNLVQTWTKISDPLDLPHIQHALPPATFIVEYWVLDDGTYAWLIGPKDFESFRLPVGKEQLETWSAQLTQSATHGRESSFKSTLAAVSAMLLRQPLTRIAQIARERKLRPRVIFVPDAATHGLPFAALPDPADPKRVLIEQYPIAVAPSATLYAVSLRRDAQFAPVKTPTVTLIGDPAFDGRLEVAHDLQRLEHARAEVESIGRTYRPVADVVLLPGARATVPAFLRAAPRSAIIHFAGHAIANPETPSRSLLLFARSKGNTGALEAQELLTKLKSERTRLVVLSACSTVGGVPIGAEGLAPLVRPILAAGVPAAVGTLWDVRDNRETEELLVQFHKHYREGDDADVALQRAQLDMLHHPKQRFHSATGWASFQVIGFASSPFARGEKEKKR